MNEIKIIGNLGKDPELQTLEGGTQVARFTIADNRRVKKGEEWQDETTWHNVTCFGKLAARVASNLEKGKTIQLVGRQENRSYEKDGKTVYYSQVVASDIHKVEFLRNDPGNAPAPPSSGEDFNW
jgi:single-strand DNA-binding protein